MSVEVMNLVVRSVAVANVSRWQAQKQLHQRKRDGKEKKGTGYLGTYQARSESAYHVPCIE